MKKDIYKSPEFCVIQLAENDAVRTSNGKDGDMYDNAFWNDVKAQIFPATFAYFYLSDSQKAICRYSTYTSKDTERLPFRKYLMRTVYQDGTAMKNGCRVQSTMC